MDNNERKPELLQHHSFQSGVLLRDSKRSISCEVQIVSVKLGKNLALTEFLQRAGRPTESWKSVVWIVEVRRPTLTRFLSFNGRHNVDVKSVIFIHLSFVS